MDDYLTSVAEAVRDACAETCNEQHTIAERRPIPATICAMHIGHIDLPAVIASVPRPEPAAWLFRHPAAGYLTVTDSGNATDDGVFPVYAEPVAAQVAVPEQWQAVARECVSHLDDGRTQPALSRSLRKLSAMLDSSVAPPVSVSHGWKLVPVEPTPGMLMAAGAAVHAATYWHRAYCAMLAATPEAPQVAAPLGTSQNPICLSGEEMAGLAEFAGISVDNREDAAGILLWVGEHRDDAGTAGYGLCASLEDYPEEGCYPLVELPRQQPADDAAALEATESVLDRPASIGGTTFGVGIPVRTLVAAAQRRYEVEQTPASLADRQALIDALRRPVVDAEIATLRSAIRAMASMLQAREWAEHVSTDPVVTDLEVQITELVGTATALRGQNAALVAALKAIDDQASHAGDEFGGPLAVATKEGLGDRDELLELAGIADGYLESISLTAEQALASAKGGAT